MHKRSISDKINGSNAQFVDADIGIIGPVILISKRKPAPLKWWFTLFFILSFIHDELGNH